MKHWLKENWFKLTLTILALFYLIVQIKAHDLEVRKAVISCINGGRDNKVCLEIYERLKFWDFKHLFW